MNTSGDPLIADGEDGSNPSEMQRPLVVRAWEELKMLSQTEIERERYEARRKAQLDYTSGMNAARREGEKSGEKVGLEKGEKVGLEKGEKVGLEKGEKLGLEKGEQIGVIHLCERMLGRPETPTEQLAALSVAELSRLADESRNLVKK
jgi:flagellar biosynthesis/type III secretory pathway protein FliH